MLNRNAYFYLMVIGLVLAPLPGESTRIYAQDSIPQAEELLDFAGGLFERGMYSMAITEYEKFMAHYAEHKDLAVAVFGIAESHFFAKDYDQAIATFSEFAQQFPEHELAPVVSLRLAQAGFFKDESKAEALDPLVDLDASTLPNKFKPIYHYYLGKRMRLLKDHTGALAAYADAVAVDPTNLYAVYAAIERAELYAEQNNWPEAIRNYESVLDKDVDPELAILTRYKLGEIQFAQDNFQGAVKALEDFVQTYADHDLAREAMNRILASYYKMDQFGELVRVYEQFQNQNPNVLSAFHTRYLYAISLTQLDRDEQALTEIKDMLQTNDVTDDQRQKLRLRQYELLLKLQDFESIVSLNLEAEIKGSQDEDKFLFYKAEALFGLEDYNAAAQLYDDLINRFPDSELVSDALYGYAHVTNMLGQADRSAELFRRYQDHSPDDEKRRVAMFNEILLNAKIQNHKAVIQRGQVFLNNYPQDDQVSTVLFRLGHAHTEMQQYTEANEVYSRYLTRFPQSDKATQVAFLKAFNHQTLNEADAAIESYQAVIVQGDDPELVYSAYKNIALLYLKNDQEAQALEAFMKLIELYPDNDLEGQTYLWIAERCLNQKRYSDVLAVLDSSEHLRETLDQEKLAYFKAEAYRGTGEFRKALAEYDTVLQLKEHGIYSGASYIGKGLCLMAIKEYEWAKFEFDAAIVKNPDDTTISMRARYELARIESILERWEASRKLFMLVAVLYDDPYYTPESLYQAGLLFEQAGLTQEAVNVYQEIVNKYPQSERAEESQNKLTQIQQ
jgi:TolA-binding protein